MALLDSLIVASCIGLSGQANDACEKALEASAKQSGVEKTTSDYEKHELKNLEDDAVSFMGKDVVNVTGGMIWLTKSLVDKKASFGIYGPLSTEIAPDLTRLVLKWKF
jgi:hypothetical protein